MRLSYFCIGSIATQDLLISQCFLPEKARAGQVQDVWSGFLNIFQEQDWPLTNLEALSTTPGSSSPSTTPSGTRRLSSMTTGALTNDRASTPPPTRVPSHVAVPLINQQDGSCYIYKVVADMVFVAVCPSPLATLAPDHPVGPTSLPHSYHALVKFLDYLTRALEKYLNITPFIHAPPRQSSGSSASSKREQLSAALITTNTSLVYELLDECLELGYPTMPSLQQLDLLIFGAAKSEQ